MSIPAPESFETFSDSNSSEVETPDSMMYSNGPGTPTYPVIKKNKEF